MCSTNIDKKKNSDIYVVNNYDVRKTNFLHFMKQNGLKNVNYGIPLHLACAEPGK